MRREDCTQKRAEEIKGNLGHRECASGASIAKRLQSSKACTNLGEAVMERQPSSVRDPVCGMEFNPQHAAATTAYQGQTFYFCRVECQEQFTQSPERYVKAA
jgi:YHS domain-containing protein